MTYVRGDSCYILKGNGYLLERVGICGTLFKEAKDMFRSEEEAEVNKKPLPPKIKVQLSDY